MTSARKILQFPKVPVRRRDYELAFLPAALEVTETPPSPTRRIVGATIILMFCGAVAWASLGTTDIVATAPGKIVPSGRTKIIQPLETGVVQAIHVQDGQSVKAGELLIELDPTMGNAELGHLRNDLVTTQLEIARLRAALAGHADPLDDFHAPDGASPALVEMQRQFLISQNSEQKEKLAEIDRQLTQKEAERATIAATITKLNTTIPLQQQRADIRKYLSDRQAGSKMDYLTEAQQLVGQQQDLLVQQSRYREADAAVAAFVETRAKVELEYRRTLFEDLAKAEQKAGDLLQDVIKAEERTRLLNLTAPVDGVVQQLAVHTVGGVVTPAQALAVVVPVDSHLEIEAMVSNRDIGFVYAGQDAEIKIDTFSFTRYGLLHGTVLSVSRDAVTRNKSEDKSSDNAPGAEASNSEPKGEEMNYVARVALDRTQMRVEDKFVNLSPGMAVTVEIKTGTRRMISYLLSPVLRYKQEVLRER
jgi:hemolysin D